MSLRVAASFMLAIVNAGACSPPPSASSVRPASLAVTGSGFVAGPWWFGHGAILTIASPGSSVPSNWSPSERDTVFDVALVAGSEDPAPVRGVRTRGADQINPGMYELVVVMTEQSDTADATMSPSLGCSSLVTVAPGTVAVRVDVQFRVAEPPCSITVSVEGLTPSAGAS